MQSGCFPPLDSNMLPSVDSKSSLAKLAEWSPSDWPDSLPEMRTIDNLLRCSICYEYFDVALIVPDCSHSYCSLCIRRSLSYEPRCPTCSIKVSPPTLKNNRVLDELVKNFIKVRTKLLELVTSGDAAKCPTTTSGTAAKKGGEVSKTSKLSSAKRRKDHGKPVNSSSSSSSSPDTKRQKLDDGSECISMSEETAANKTEAVESCSGSSREGAVIDTEKSCDEQAGSEMHPVTVEKDTSEKQTTQQPADTDVAECPVCGDMVPHKKINFHLDTCLTRTEKKSSLRRKASKEPRSICSTSAKIKNTPSLESKKYEAVSSDDTFSSILDQEPCSSKAIGSSSTLAVKGSNALIQKVQKRKPLPKLVYNVMAEKELRQRLKDLNLSTKGDKASLVKRHHDYVLLYNAQCDSVKPKSAAQIAKEVETAEKTRAEEASSLNEPSTSTGLRFEKNQTEEDMDKVRQKYLKEHEQQFNKLILDVQNRRQGNRKKTAKEILASETLSIRKESETGEESLKSEKDDSLHLRCDDRDPDKSAASLATDSSLLGVNNKDSSTLNKSKSSSIIPEPPSSPSLVSLSDEDDEFTPSLGLDNNDLDCKDEDSRDPNVIPESPVINIGKAGVANINRDIASSDSEEE